MEFGWRTFEFQLVMLMVITVIRSSDAVSVKPCPTNKIAKRITNVGSRERTLGAFYDLFSHNNQQQPYQGDSVNDEDDDDCGEIDDYDENDLSSIQKGPGLTHDRFFFNPPYVPNQPPYRPQRPPIRPPTRPPIRPPTRPTRPPYSSGGYFENNPYRPPTQQNPSDTVKPIYEDTQEINQSAYQPGIVGGPSGFIVGATQVRPPRYPLQNIETTTQRNIYTREPQTSRPTYPTRPNYPVRPNYPERPNYPVRPNYPERTTQTPVYPTRRPRPRRLNNDDSIIGSFVDLLFK